MTSKRIGKARKPKAPAAATTTTAAAAAAAAAAAKTHISAVDPATDWIKASGDGERTLSGRTVHLVKQGDA
jgi:hypothetical protein